MQTAQGKVKSCVRASNLSALLLLLEGGQLHLLAPLFLQHFHLELLQELAVLVIQPGLVQLQTEEIV